MKLVEGLLNKAIPAEWVKLMADAERIDITTFSVNKTNLDLLRGIAPETKVRFAIGGIDEEDRKKAVALRSIRTFPRDLWENKEVRYCQGLHAKLFIAYNPGLTVVVGSQNFGIGPTIETAVALRGREAKFFVSVFEEIWERSWQIKPLDLDTMKAKLETSVFEDRRESTSPVTTTETGKEKQ